MPAVRRFDRPRTTAPELAEVVYDRSCELAWEHQSFEPGVVAVDLLDAAHGSQSTLEHALEIAQRQLERNPADVKARLAVHLIEAAINFLGPHARRHPSLATR